jgi:hypothetical protein
MSRKGVDSGSRSRNGKREASQGDFQKDQGRIATPRSGKGSEVFDMAQSVLY